MAEHSDQQYYPRAGDAVMPQHQYQQSYTETQHEPYQQQQSRSESVYSQDNDHSITEYTSRNSQHQTDAEDIEDIVDIRDIGQAEIDMPEPVPQQPWTRGKRFRLWVMKITTVPRLRLLWGLLALFGSMSWLAVMPAYAFRNSNGPPLTANPSYTNFLVATVGTSVTAIWQSLCPFLTRQSQHALLPRIINHPATQTGTIFISVLLTILNFFSWIVLAANEDGAKTSCTTGPLSTLDGYATQCRGVNVAIALNAVVFLLWTPISIVIVCGTLERGMWWWGKGDGWASTRFLTRRSKMVSQEVFDLKAGAGQSSRSRQNQEDEDLQDMYYGIQQPKPAFVTPIASQFRQPSAADMGLEPEEGAHRNEGYRPSDYSDHHQQYQQQQYQQQQQQQQQQQSHQAPTPQQQPTTLVRKVSNGSLAPSFSSRLSTFFGAGWSSGPMPPAQSETLALPGPTQRRLGPSRLNEEHTKPASEITKNSEEPDKTSLHGDEYTTQWHNRRNDEWS
ncbi:hypothetical protein BGZ51_007207 [Haplosporangium sp. Z 767]|nr:hypothetical protein BGZ51_007207 [Haplosporangium sp. Z 767]KAF9193660.1 hypothetical protein BGZ50_007236 [Haplosporangium sp. Z 11]